MKKTATVDLVATSHQPSAFAPLLVMAGLPAKLRNALTTSHVITCQSRKQIGQAAELAGKSTNWVVSKSEMVERLIEVLAKVVPAQKRRNPRLGNLLILNTIDANAAEMLRGIFASVVGGEASYRFLPPDQLAEVLSASQASAKDVIIGGLVDTKRRVMMLVRGDLTRNAAPLSVFPFSGGSKPDFRRFEIDDFGQTLRFGAYEAGADFVLYAVDPEFRSRINARRRLQGRGFGPSLRRLRSLRRIRRDQFNGITAKTIARIERGEVSRPHGRTLAAICRILSVTPEEIESY